MTEELFNAAPTIRAMGREAEFETVVNAQLYINNISYDFFMGALKRTKFFGMAVWASYLHVYSYIMAGRSTFD